jgi:hypothetical protein
LVGSLTFVPADLLPAFRVTCERVIFWTKKGEGIKLVKKQNKTKKAMLRL